MVACMQGEDIYIYSAGTKGELRVQTVRIKTTLACLAELDSLHSHPEAVKGCAIYQVIWKSVPYHDAIREEGIPMSVLVNGTRYLDE